MAANCGQSPKKESPFIRIEGNGLSVPVGIVGEPRDGKWTQANSKTLQGGFKEIYKWRKVET